MPETTIPVINLIQGDTFDVKFDPLDENDQLELAADAVVNAVMRKGTDDNSSLAESQWTVENQQTPVKQVSLTMTPEESAMLEQETYYLQLTIDGEKWPIMQVSLQGSL